MPLRLVDIWLLVHHLVICFTFKVWVTIRILFVLIILRWILVHYQLILYWLDDILVLIIRIYWSVVWLQALRLLYIFLIMLLRLHFPNRTLLNRWHHLHSIQVILRLNRTTTIALIFEFFVRLNVITKCIKLWCVLGGIFHCYKF